MPRLVKRPDGGVMNVNSASAPTSQLIKGNFQSYHPGGSPWQVYTGMWGMYLGANAPTSATSSMRIASGSFPAKTTLSWDVTPKQGYAGVNGFLALNYGNYDGSAGSITPKQVKNIVDLTINATWTYMGDGSSGLLSELWLSPAAASSGGFTHLFEIAFFPRFSQPVKDWLLTLPTVGTGFTVNGVKFLVRQATDSSGTAPYLIAYRPDYKDIQGALPYKQFFDYLTAQSIITGNEWVNGVAFGVEPHQGKASLKLDTFSVRYS